MSEIIIFDQLNSLGIVDDTYSIIKEDKLKLIAMKGQRIYKFSSCPSVIARWKNEASTLRFLKNKGAHISPTLLSINSFGDIMCFVQEWIDGTPLEQFTDITAVNNRIIKSLNKLYSLQNKRVVWRKRIFHRVKKYINIIKTNNELSDNMIASIEEYIQDNIDSIPIYVDNLIHGDLISSNIIITKSQKAMFVDMEWSEIGDPAFDLAKTRFWLSDSVNRDNLYGLLHINRSNENFYFVILLLKQLAMAKELRKIEIWDSYLENDKSMLSIILNEPLEQ